MASNAFKLSAQGRALTELFAAASIGATVTFREMSKATGEDIQQRRYLALNAMDRVNGESGAIFASVYDIGYQRVEGEDYHTVGVHARRRLRATTKRAKTKLVNAVEKTNDLSPEARKKAVGEINALSLLNYLATEKLRAMVPEAEKPMPVALTLAAMLRG